MGKEGVEWGHSKVNMVLDGIFGIENSVAGPREKGYIEKHEVVEHKAVKPK